MVVFTKMQRFPVLGSTKGFRSAHPYTSRILLTSQTTFSYVCSSHTSMTRTCSRSNIILYFAMELNQWFCESQKWSVYYTLSHNYYYKKENVLLSNDLRKMVGKRAKQRRRREVWYNWPISGRRTKWTQSHPTPKNTYMHK
jgi:hypothetical protein